jgi:hypothetical protein
LAVLVRIKSQVTEATTVPNQQSVLPFTDGAPSHRAMLIARWLELVRNILPGMSKQHSWPISQDHCFMRVCLDTALGAPWHTVIRRPAIRHLSDEQLGAAIMVAQALVLAPQALEAINRQSILWRKDMLSRNG